MRLLLAEDRGRKHVGDASHGLNLSRSYRETGKGYIALGKSLIMETSLDNSEKLPADALAC